MARDKGDDSGKRRWGRGGKPEEGPSDDELGWLADLRGGRDDRRPLGEEPRSRRASGDEPPTGSMRRGEEPPTGSMRRGEEPPTGSMRRGEEPPTGSMRRGDGPAGAGAAGPGVGARPARRTPPVPPVSPAPPPIPPAAAPPPPPPPAAPASPPARGGLLRRRSSPPATPPPPAAPPPSAPAGGGRAGGSRPMIDWSDLTSEIPKAPEQPPGMTPRAFEPPTRAPEPPSRGRPAELRTGDLRTGDVRTGDVRAGGPPPGPAARPGPPPVPPRVDAPRPAGPPPGVGTAPDGVPRDPMVTTGMIRRAELRKHLKVQQQLKVGTLVLVALLLLAAYPVYLFAQAGAADPVYSELNDLELPEWATYDHADVADGSRWCIGECKIRKRTWASERAPEETNTVYSHALIDGGWRLRPEDCPQVADGSFFSCWKKDEYIMLMHVYAPLCEAPPTREPIPGVTTTGEPAAGPTQPACPGAYITVEVWNAIAYNPAGG